MRSVIKRGKVIVDAEHGAGAGHPRPGARPAPGVRLIPLEEGVYAIELTCRCGEVSLIEIESDGPTPPTERSA